MTMHEDAIGEAVETGAKVVKLAASDWRRISLVAVAALLALVVTVYQLALNIGKGEVERLDKNDTEYVRRAEQLDVRVKHLEDVQADVAVLKNDVGWIRREMERHQRVEARK